MKTFTLQHTGAAYGGAIPESAWSDVACGDLRAMRRHMEDSLEQMRVTCGGGCNDHYRIIANQDTVMIGTQYCNQGGMAMNPSCMVSQQYRFVWRAGMPEYECDPLLTGTRTQSELWYRNMCPHCAEKLASWEADVSNNA